MRPILSSKSDFQSEGHAMVKRKLLSIKLPRYFAVLRAIPLFDRLSYVLLLTLFGVFLLTFQHYGVTWDEPPQHAYGQMILRYYKTFFEDRSALSYANLYYYGGFFDSLAAAAVRLSPLGLYETRHFLNGLFGILSVIGCFSLARLLAGARAGFLALLIICFSPAYYGHMFNNPKDIPFSAFYVWSVYYLVKFYLLMPTIPKSLIFKLGFSIGLTLSVRIGGLLLIAYLLLAVAAFLVPRCMKISSPSASLKSIALLAVSVFSICSISFGIMYLFWPWIHENTFTRIFQAGATMSRFHFFNGIVLFRGQMLPATQLPPEYLSSCILIKLPEITLFGLSVALIILLSNLIKRRHENVMGHFKYLIVFVSITMPIVYALYNKSVLYDEMRHFLFIVPLVSAISGVSLSIAYDYAQKARYKTYVMGGILGVYCAYQLLNMISLHPNQYIYYNMIVGGVKGAEGKYALDYWGNSYKEAAKELVRYLKKRDGAHFTERRYRVAVCGPLHSAGYYFPENIHLVKIEKEAEFYMSLNCLSCDTRRGGRDIIRITRLGATLSIVRELATSAAYGSENKRIVGSYLPKENL